MRTKFIEACDSGNFNWGKFAVCEFDSEEWSRTSAVSGTRRLLSAIGHGPGEILVVDLQTCEGAIFTPPATCLRDL